MTGRDVSTAGTVSEGHELILFVDDEASLTLLGKMTLEPLGYGIVLHTSGLEALADFNAAPGRFDLEITDQTIPQMTGEMLPEFAAVCQHQFSPCFILPDTFSPQFCQLLPEFASIHSTSGLVPDTLPEQFDQLLPAFVSIHFPQVVY